MASDIKLDGDNVIIDGPWLIANCADFRLDGGPSRRNGSKTTFRRAFVHEPGDKLTINYGQDYSGGVEIQGKTTISGSLKVNVIEGTDLTLDRGQEKSSFGLNFKSPNGYWHLSGPRTFEGDQNSFSIFWYDNTKWNGPYLSITDDGNITLSKVEIQGDASVGNDVGVGQQLRVGTGNVRVPDSVPGRVIAAGAYAGFSFVDRDLKKWPEKPEAGNRFTWYAKGGIARLWSHSSNALGKDLLTIDKDGVLKAKGIIDAPSSRELKENISQLSSQEAMAALKDLNPVKFNYKPEIATGQRVGFIAEDAPALIATDDHKGIKPLDVVAVLTKVVQEQQAMISDLVAEVQALKLQVQPNA